MSWFQTDLDFKGLNEERQKQLQIAPLTKAKKNEGANVLKEVKRYQFEIDNLRICRVNMPE